MSEKILIIKDGNNYCDRLKMDLENKNYDVVIFDDGEEIVKVINDYAPQLIIIFTIENKIKEYYILNEKSEFLRATGIPVMIITNGARQDEIKGSKDMKIAVCALMDSYESKKAIKYVDDYFAKAGGDKIKSKYMDNKTIKEISDAGKSKGLKILLVEDDEFLREICKKKLELEGFNVAVAIDGVEALKKVDEYNPGLILLDVILPGVDGFEILKTVKANPKKANIPIIMLTNLGQTGEVEKGLGLGADEYIVKAHYTVGEIIEKIKEVLKKKNIKY